MNTGRNGCGRSIQLLRSGNCSYIPDWRSMGSQSWLKVLYSCGPKPSTAGVLQVRTSNISSLKIWLFPSTEINFGNSASSPFKNVLSRDLKKQEKHPSKAVPRQTKYLDTSLVYHIKDDVWRLLFPKTCGQKCKRTVKMDSPLDTKVIHLS